MLGIPPGPCVSLDTDLATTLQADRVFRIDGPVPAILHFELEGNGRLGIPKELLRYNVLTAHPHDIPVLSLLILLRRSALASDMTGTYIRRDSGGSPIVVFNYHIEKVWERSVDFWLRSGAGLAPLAMLTDEAEAGLDNALGRLWKSLQNAGIERKLVHDVFGSSFILCGMRYGNERLLETFVRIDYVSVFDQEGQ